MRALVVDKLATELLVALSSPAVPCQQALVVSLEQIHERGPVLAAHDIQLDPRSGEQDAKAEAGALHVAGHAWLARLGQDLGLPMHAVQAEDPDLEADAAQPELGLVELGQPPRAVLWVWLTVHGAPRVKARLVGRVPGQLTSLSRVQLLQKLGVAEQKVFGVLISGHRAAKRVAVLTHEQIRAV